MAWLGAVAGGVLSYMGSKEQNKAAGKSGWTDITTEQRPSDESAGYRNWAMQRAFGILNPGEAPPWNRPVNTAPPPNGAGGGGVGNRAGTEPTVLYAGGKAGKTAAQKSGKTVIPKPGTGKGGAPRPAKPGKGSPAATSGAGGKWTGTSDQTRLIVDNAIDQAQKGNRLYGEAEDFISGTLSGSPQQDRNAYRTETADMLRNMDDPDVKRLKDTLFADYEATRGGYNKGGGPGGSGGSRLPIRYSGSASTPFTQQTAGGGAGLRTAGAKAAVEKEREGPVGVVDDLKGILEGKGAPQAVKDAIARRNEEEWNRRIAEKMGLYVGNGNMGSSNWTQALGDVNTISARELGDTLAMADYGLYQHGLDTGSAYDLATLDRESREKMAAEDRAASAAASASAAGSAYDAARMEAQSRMDLARLDALGQAVGMGQRQNEFRTTGMGSLADLYSQDQRFALGATPDITGLGMRDWTAAGQLSLGSDQNRNTFDIGKRNADAARAGVNATNQRLAFDKERYQHDVPFMDLSRYMDIINAADRGGSTRQFGQTPPSGQVVNPGMAAVGGAAAGWSLGKSFQQYYGEGNKS